MAPGSVQTGIAWCAFKRSQPRVMRYTAHSPSNAMPSAQVPKPINTSVSGNEMSATRAAHNNANQKVRIC